MTPVKLVKLSAIEVIADALANSVSTNTGLAETAAETSVNIANMMAQMYAGTISTIAHNAESATVFPYVAYDVEESTANITLNSHTFSIPTFELSPKTIV